MVLSCRFRASQWSLMLGQVDYSFLSGWQKCQVDKMRQRQCLSSEFPINCFNFCPKNRWSDFVSYGLIYFYFALIFISLSLSLSHTHTHTLSHTLFSLPFLRFSWSLSPTIDFRFVWSRVVKKLPWGENWDSNSQHIKRIFHSNKSYSHFATERGERERERVCVWVNGQMIKTLRTRPSQILKQTFVDLDDQKISRYPDFRCNVSVPFTGMESAQIQKIKIKDKKKLQNFLPR
jgi:hypothetical protein